MRIKRFLSYERDAIGGILAATVALVLYQLHIVGGHVMLLIVIILMALLFINFIHYTRHNECIAEQVERTQKMVSSIKSYLATPGVVEIYPRQLQTANVQCFRNMRGNSILFTVCLSTYRMQPPFDVLLRRTIENPQVSSIQFVLDASPQDSWQAEILPKITSYERHTKVQEPLWYTLSKNISFYPCDTPLDGATGALLSIWGGPSMSHFDGRNVPRYIFHMQERSELLTHRVEMERNCRAHT